MKGLRQSNKGFTLVELCVTMVIISLLASITTFSLISWQHDSIANQEDLNAELIYMAVKNKIAKYKANGVIEEIPWWINYNPKDNVNTDAGDDVAEMESRSGYKYIMCDRDDYENYYIENNMSEVSKSAPIIFDIIKDYVKDKSILKACICIEFDDQGNIMAVFYSDRLDEFSYKYTSKQLKEIYHKDGIRITNLKTKPDVCYDNLVGLYIPK